ncbi:hypothetical protein FOL47_005613 [Perkinsus chesapeaki]|uniref:Peptidase A1 domain-containing protein n=1 Tax=Perkinsus chesapeaki TaxID=330153 RepID=A0A7J6MYF2_PERCH|nr:hypothetical protein FOL47_005613 [Perkinsus chesapeaki]
MAFLPRPAFIAAIMSVKASHITIPFADNRVSLALDGQYANFMIDTGSARSFAIYGPEYERRNGEGSCKHVGVCYFCLPDSPCHDIFERKKWNVRFSDGDVYTYVEHTVSLKIGEVTIKDFKIGLAIDFYNDREDQMTVPVCGQLGLSYGRKGIPETFLEQLQRREVITHLAYWVRTGQDGSYFAGNLTLDDSSRTYSYAMRLSTTFALQRRKFYLPVWPLQLMNPPSHFIPRRQTEALETNRVRPALANVDTGAGAIFTTSGDFEFFLEAAGRYLWMGAKSQLFMVKKGDVDNLPTLIFDIGESSIKNRIRLRPKHYVRCDQYDNCFVHIISGADGSYSFGQPFFHAYHVGFDLSSTTTSMYLKAQEFEEAVASLVPLKVVPAATRAACEQEPEPPVRRSEPASVPSAARPNLGALDSVVETGVLWNCLEFLDGDGVIALMRIIGESHPMYSPEQIDKRIFGELLGGAPRQHRLPKGWKNQQTWLLIQNIGLEYLCELRIAASDLTGQPIQFFDPSVDFKSGILRRIRATEGSTNEILEWVLGSSIYLLMGILPTDNSIDIISLVFYLNPAGRPCLLFTRGTRRISQRKFSKLDVMMCRLPNQSDVDFVHPFRDFYAISEGTLRLDQSLISPKSLLRIDKGNVVSANAGSPCAMVELMALMGTPEVIHAESISTSAVTVDRTLVNMIRRHAQVPLSYFIIL